MLKNGTIELDNIDTWGENIKELLLKINAKEEKFNEKLKRKNVFEKLSKVGIDEIEKYKKELELLENQIKDNLNIRRVICYHCTRLTQADYNSIKENGLIALTKENQIDRIKK